MSGPRRTGATDHRPRARRGARPPRRWTKGLLVGLGAMLVVLAVGTVAVQSWQASEARAETEYARALVEWEDCRIDAIVNSGVTDELIESIKQTNESVRRSSSFEGSKRPRNELTAKLATLQNQRDQARRDQAVCGAKPARPDGSPS